VVERLCSFAIKSYSCFYRCPSFVYYTSGSGGINTDVKAFYHQQSEAVRKSFSELSKALMQRYEGGLALLKYKRDFNSRSRKEGEPLHSYLADLRVG